MSTDTEEFEYAIFSVCDAYEKLRKIHPNHPLLSHIEFGKDRFIPTEEYQRRYVRPYLKDDGGQLCFWDGVYPNQFEARLIGLVKYQKELSSAINSAR